jgi:glyoxylase-like metal-dependent hydrolase (beta-lactamase superfamily II)
MPVTRRAFLSTTASTLALGLWPARAFAQPAAPAAPPVTSFVELRRGVGTFLGNGGTIGHLVNGAGAVAIDSQFANTAAIAVAGLKQRAPQGIEMLLNTHHHGDHTGGNQVLRGALKRIVADANCLEWHRKTAAAAKSEAQTSFADTTFTDAWKTTFGDETIQARDYGAGHTSGDAVYHFEKADVVHMGDLLSTTTLPGFDDTISLDARLTAGVVLGICFDELTEKK